MRKEIIEKERPTHTPKEIETESADELWVELNPDTKKALEDITELVSRGMEKVRTGITEDGIVSVTVRKAADNSIIYYTENPSEVEILKDLEIMPG